MLYDILINNNITDDGVYIYIYIIGEILTMERIDSDNNAKKCVAKCRTNEHILFTFYISAILTLYTLLLYMKIALLRCLSLNQYIKLLKKMINDTATTI